MEGIEGPEPCPEALQGCIPAMYECTLVRLRATDMDQEVKERAIAAAGQLLCHFGDYLEVSLSNKKKRKKRKSLSIYFSLGTD